MCSAAPTARLDHSKLQNTETTRTGKKVTAPADNIFGECTLQQSITVTQRVCCSNNYYAKTNNNKEHRDITDRQDRDDTHALVADTPSLNAC